MKIRIKYFKYMLRYGGGCKYETHAYIVQDIYPHPSGTMNPSGTMINSSVQ